VIWIAAIVVAAAVAGGGWFVRAWRRERRAHSVFPASQARSLLHPARKLHQRPRPMMRAFAVSPGDCVLELGPGPGFFTAEAARAAGRAGRVVCIDLQAGMIRALREHLDADVLDVVRPLVGDATHLPLAGASVDRAFLVAVLGEVPDQRRALRELRRVLRPGGTVSFAETFADPDYVRVRALQAMARDAGLTFVDRRRQPLGYLARFRRPA